jgi:hypothetical protein
MLQRVLAFLLIIGLLAAAPLPGIAQDKDKDDKKADVKDDAKKDDTKKDDVKKDEPASKPEEPKKAAPSTHLVAVPSKFNLWSEGVSEILPVVTLILIVILFLLLLGVRSEIRSLEQKITGGDGKA